MNASLSTLYWLVCSAIFTIVASMACAVSLRYVYRFYNAAIGLWLRFRYGAPPSFLQGQAVAISAGLLAENRRYQETRRQEERDRAFVRVMRRLVSCGIGPDGEAATGVARCCRFDVQAGVVALNCEEGRHLWARMFSSPLDETGAVA